MNVHFIGIGGIGVSALAKYFLARGAVVTGSDLVSTEITKDLERRGVAIAYGPHKKANILKATKLVVYTSAVPARSPELAEAKKRKIKTRSYAEVLGDLTKQYKTITISGSHGKSTTTALVSLILEEGYFDPTVIVGTSLKEFGNSNFRHGHSRYLVLEADEWNKSFLNYRPSVALLTNIDLEHLDTYKNEKEIERTFRNYLKRLPKDGVVVANHDDERTRRVAEGSKKKVHWYSLKSPEATVVRNILKIPGEHNVSNALGALAVGRALGIPEPMILRALSRYRGAWRRFEFKGYLNGASVIDDYGHHPREITSTIRAARDRFPFQRVWCVYQPHQYQRLRHLWDDFKGAFDMADRVCLLPVYDVAGRETKSAKIAVNSQKLVHELIRRGKEAYHMNSFAKAERFLQKSIRPGDVVLMMGAGDITSLSKTLLEPKVN